MKFTLEKMEKVQREETQSLEENERLAKIIIFKILMKQLFDQIANDKQRRQAKLYVRENLHTLQLSMFIEVGIAQWLTDDVQLPIRDFPTESLQRIVNLAYVGICEYFGPVEADKMLRDAVNRTAKAESNKYFSVKNLI